MSSEPVAVETDVLVIGSGAAGMYAAIEASRGGARVFLVDRSLIGRGGATVMAQMTVAAALGEEVPDAPRHAQRLFEDRLAALNFVLTEQGEAFETVELGLPLALPGRLYPFQSLGDCDEGVGKFAAQNQPVRQ